MKIALPRRADVHWPRWLHRFLPWLALALLAFAITSLAGDARGASAQGLAGTSCQLSDASGRVMN
jgi:hypothetical protein